MRPRPYVLFAVATVALAGCSSSKSSSGATSTTSGGADLAVTAKSFSFAPSTLTVKAGDPRTLVFTAKDIAHDFSVKELDIHVAASGGHTVRKSVTFDKPGTYTYYCSIAGHREAGMTGTVVVQ